ncbi:MAG: 4-oxalocrotonate tautomerase family protein [Burkholderiales bacterium]
MNIRLIEKALGDNPAAKKAEIGSRVTQAICEVSGLPQDAVWVVFENVEPEHWHVGGKTVAAMWKDRKK